MKKRRFESICKDGHRRTISYFKWFKCTKVNKSYTASLLDIQPNRGLLIRIASRSYGHIESRLIPPSPTPPPPAPPPKNVA